MPLQPWYSRDMQAQQEVVPLSFPSNDQETNRCNWNLTSHAVFTGTSTASVSAFSGTEAMVTTPGPRGSRDVHSRGWKGWTHRGPPLSWRCAAGPRQGHTWQRRVRETSCLSAAGAESHSAARPLPAPRLPGHEPACTSRPATHASCASGEAGACLACACLIFFQKPGQKGLQLITFKLLGSAALVVVPFHTPTLSYSAHPLEMYVGAEKESTTSAA